MDIWKQDNMQTNRIYNGVWVIFREQTNILNIRIFFRLEQIFGSYILKNHNQINYIRDIIK